MNPQASPIFAYDGFASYATDPDRAVVRDIEILVEGLHQNKLVPPPYRKSLELCVDGSDFRLPLRQKGADGSTQSGIREILIAYLAQSRHLVVFVGPESKNHIWLNFELNWWIENRGAQSILLAVTHGYDPKNERPSTFPDAILENGIDQWPWFDLRGYRKTQAVGTRDYEEEKIRLAAALMGPEVSAATLVAGWKRAAAVRRRRQIVLRTLSAIVAILGMSTLAWVLYLWRNSSMEARVSDWALASRQLGTGALNRKLDSLAYALAAMSQAPTPEGYASLISAIEPLPVHLRTIRHDDGKKAVDVLRFLVGNRILLSAGYTGVAQFSSAEEGTLLTRVAISGRAAAIAEWPMAPLIAVATSKGVDLLTYARDPANPAPRVLSHLDAGDRVRAVAFHPRERTLVVGAFDGTLTMYVFGADLQSWRIKRRIVLKDKLGAKVGINGLAPDWNAGRIAVVDIEGLIYVLETDRWTFATSPVRYSTEIFGLDVSQQGTVAAGSDADGGAVLFTPRTGQIVARLATAANFQTVGGDFEGAVRTSQPTEYPRTGIAFSHDGALLAVAGHDRTVRLYTTKEQSLARVIVEQDATRSVAFSQTGELIATGSDDGTINLWSLAQYAERWRYAGIESIAIDHDRRKVAVTTDKGSSRVLAVQTGVISNILTTPDSQTQSGSLDGLSFTRDGRYVASRVSGSTRAFAWSLVSEADGSSPMPRILQHPNESGHVATVATLRPGARQSDLLTGEGYQGHDVRVWEANSGTQRLTLHLTDQVFQVGAGEEVIVAADKSGELRVWSSLDGAELAGLKLPGSPAALTVSPAGRRLFVGYSQNAKAGGKLCEIPTSNSRFDLRQVCRDVRLPASPTEAQFSESGRLLAISTYGDTLGGGRLFLASESDGWRIKDLESRSLVQSLSFSLNEAFLAIGQREGGIAIWDTATRTLRASIPVVNPVRGVLFGGPPDDMVISLDGVTPGFIRGWDWHSSSLIAQGCARWPPDYHADIVPATAALPSRSSICRTK